MSFIDKMDMYLEEAEKDLIIPRFLETSAYDTKMCDRVSQAYEKGKNRNNYDLHHTFYAYLQYLADTYHLEPIDLEMGAQIYIRDLMEAGSMATEATVKNLFPDYDELPQVDVKFNFDYKSRDKVIDIRNYFGNNEET